MRKLIAAVTLTFFAAAPAFAGEGCTYMDDAKADGPPSTLLGAAQPESSKIPDSAFTKTQTPVKKQVASKPKSAAPDRKVAAANTAL